MLLKSGDNSIIGTYDMYICSYKARYHAEQHLAIHNTWIDIWATWDGIQFM